MENYYQLLALPPSASADEIKKAFRAEIARYHPDKVQHLGKEFQEMAATRAASLTEAYRTLMNPEMRAEYDRMLGAARPGAAASASAPPPAAASAASSSASRAPAYEPPPPPPPSAPSNNVPPPGAGRPSQFAKEQATRDEFVRKATMAKIRQAFGAELGSMAERPTKGFDLDCVSTKRKLFGGAASHRYVVRVVPVVNREAVIESWGLAQKAGDPVCVFLMGSSMASSRELGEAITEMRKKSRDSQITIIPVDVRDWSAHVPADAPANCKSILQRLRQSV